MDSCFVLAVNFFMNNCSASIEILTISNYIKWKQDLELSYLALHENKYMSNAESMPQHKELLA